MLRSRIVTASLVLAGFNAVPVADPQEFLAVLAAATPEVVVIRMTTPPQDDWRSVIDCLRHTGVYPVKMVVIIPADEAEATPSAPRPRADACLTTPFDPAEMIHVVRDLAGRQSAQLAELRCEQLGAGPSAEDT